MLFVPVGIFQRDSQKDKIQTIHGDSLQAIHIDFDVEVEGNSLEYCSRAKS